MTDVTIRSRHAVFRHFGAIAIVITMAGVILLIAAAGSIRWEAALTAATAWFSGIYFVQKQRLEELHLFKDLFTAFNRRYDELNEHLERIAAAPGELTSVERATLVSYFNLCGEEYLYYRLGYIYPEVWDAWYAGMKHYYRNPRIREFWSAELAEGSYYGLSSRSFRC